MSVILLTKGRPQRQERSVVDGDQPLGLLYAGR